MDDDNVFQFGSIKGGKAEKEEKEFPANPYVVVDTDDNEFEYDGYLIFTTHHICIMQEGDENGPVTALMMPLNRLKFVCIDQDEVTEE